MIGLYMMEDDRIASPRISSGGHRAFTLVELLVVIGVISLLMGILLPALNKARAAARSTSCRANLHSLAIAFRAYLDDNRNTMPPAAHMPWNSDNPNERLPTIIHGPDGDITVILPSIVEYIGQYLSVSIAELAEENGKKCYAKVLCCPSDRKNGETKHYFRIQQSSYDYAAQLGNQSMDSAAFTKNAPERDIEVMWDYYTFHGKAGVKGAKNYLYSDCHVGDLNGD